MQCEREPLTRSYRLRLWWMGLDNLDRLSIMASVFLLVFVFWFLSFLLGLI